MTLTIYPFLEEDDWEVYPRWDVAQKYRHNECRLFYKDGINQFKKTVGKLHANHRERMYAVHCICRVYQMFRYWNKYNLIHEGRFL